MSEGAHELSAKLVRVFVDLFRLNIDAGRWVPSLSGYHWGRENPIINAISLCTKKSALAALAQKVDSIRSQPLSQNRQLHGNFQATEW
jgi:hypothetical protein